MEPTVVPLSTRVSAPTSQFFWKSCLVHLEQSTPFKISRSNGCSEEIEREHGGRRMSPRLGPVLLPYISLRSLSSRSHSHFGFLESICSASTVYRRQLLTLASLCRDLGSPRWVSLYRAISVLMPSILGENDVGCRKNNIWARDFSIRWFYLWSGSGRRGFLMFDVWMLFAICMFDLKSTIFLAVPRGGEDPGLRYLDYLTLILRLYICEFPDLMFELHT